MGDFRLGSLVWPTDVAYAAERRPLRTLTGLGIGLTSDTTGELPRGLRPTTLTRMGQDQELFVLGANDWVGTLVVGGAVTVGVGVGLLLLMVPSGNRRAALLLGAFLLAASSTVLGQLIANQGLAYRYRILEFIPILQSFALGPLAYFYIRARIEPARAFGRSVWLHALLPVAHFGLQLWVWTSPNPRRAWYYENVHGPFGSTAEDVLFAVTLAAYVGASWVLVRGEMGSREVRSAPALRSFVAFLTVALVASTVFNLALLRFPSEWLGSWVGLVEEVSYSALVFWLASIVLLGLLGRTAVSVEIPRARTERYGMGPDELARQTAEVVDLIARERMHLDPDLTLTRLADELEMPEKILSFVLNEGIGSGYRDYINGLRVDEAKAQLADPGRADRSVLVIATDSGFNSKATFNRIFKRFTGRTPTEYRKNQGVSGLKSS